MRRVKQPEDWGTDYELWPLDLRDVDLGLIEDKLERALRDAYTRVLLLDSRSRKAVLVVPSCAPHSLLSKILSLLFENFQIPTITLVPPPTMSAFAAGQRSGLVVDIGWHETTITVVYELREVRTYRSTRAMKTLVSEMGRMLQGHLPQDVSGSTEDEKMVLDFYYVEELVTQIAWCPFNESMSLQNGMASLSISDNSPPQALQDDTEISVPLPRASDRPVKIPFSSLSKPVESILLAVSQNLREQDDQERPLQYLMYEILLSLRQDVRAVCMSRIMFTGGGANITGLKPRLLQELSRTVATRGWDPVWGKAAEEYRRRKAELMRQRNLGVKHTIEDIAEDGLADEAPEVEPAALRSQDSDEIGDKLKEQALKGTTPSVDGVIRGLQTLGAWAGASLTALLRIKSVVEIDKDVYLQHGLAGAKRESDLNPGKSKSQTNLARMNASDNQTWTLGVWA